MLKRCPAENLSATYRFQFYSIIPNNVGSVPYICVTIAINIGARYANVALFKNGLTKNLFIGLQV